MRQLRVARSSATAASFIGLFVALLGCGGRASSCDVLQEDCNPAPAAAVSSPAAAAPVSPPAAAAPASPPPPEPSEPPQPVGAGDLDTTLLAEGAASAGCIGSGLIDKLLPAPPEEPLEPSEPQECYAFRPYTDSGGSCQASWCGSLALPRVASCSPIQATFGGGYHYYVEGPEVSADFFFFPVAQGEGRTPKLDDLGSVRLEFAMSPTLSGEPVQMGVYLEAQQAIALGLTQIADTLVGTLSLDPLTPGVLGPWYDEECGASFDEDGRPSPTATCACRLDVPPLAVDVYVPLAPTE